MEPECHQIDSGKTHNLILLGYPNVHRTLYTDVYIVYTEYNIDYR